MIQCTPIRWLIVEDGPKVRRTEVIKITDGYLITQFGDKFFFNKIDKKFEFISSNWRDIHSEKCVFQDFDKAVSEAQDFVEKCLVLNP